MTLLGVTGCGSSHHGEDTAKRQTPAEHGATQPVRVLTQDQLDRAVVDTHDLPGVSVGKISGAPGTVGEGGIHAVNGSDTHPTACAPVSAALGAASRYEPVASVERTADMKDTGAFISLVSYRTADAPRVISGLRTALRTCRTFKAGYIQSPYTHVTAADAPSAGDEGIAFDLTLIMNPGKHALKVPVSMVVVRQGSAVAFFKRTSEPGEPAKIPASLIQAQSVALATAVHGTR